MIVDDVSGGLGSFNSEFRTKMMNATTNAELTLVLNIAFDKVTKAAQPTIQNSDGTTFQVIDWTHDGWERFKRNFRQMGRPSGAANSGSNRPMARAICRSPPPGGSSSATCGVACGLSCKRATPALTTLFVRSE